MSHLPTLILVAAAILIVTRPLAAYADAQQVVAECRQEAMKGHTRVGRLLPSLGLARDSHRSRMAAICYRWQSIKAEAAGALLEECLAEAGRGPRVYHRGRDLDRHHVARQRALCRKLAETFKK